MAELKGYVYLPKSKVSVCLKPGATLTPEEADDLDEYFLTIAEARNKRSKS